MAIDGATISGRRGSRGTTSSARPTAAPRTARSKLTLQPSSMAALLRLLRGETASMRRPLLSSGSTPAPLAKLTATEPLGAWQRHRRSLAGARRFRLELLRFRTTDGGAWPGGQADRPPMALRSEDCGPRRPSFTRGWPGDNNDSARGSGAGSSRAPSGSRRRPANGRVAQATFFAHGFAAC